MGLKCSIYVELKRSKFLYFFSNIKKILTQSLYPLLYLNTKFITSLLKYTHYNNKNKEIMKMKKNNYIIIAGCSRFGANIASILSSKDYEVVIIDIDKSNFRKISRDYSGFKIEGNATDVEVLVEAGIKKADTLVCATNNDNTNIMISEIGKEIFNVENVVSRLYDTEKEIVYKDFDINTIYPTKLTINEFEKLLGKMKTQYIEDRKVI